MALIEAVQLVKTYPAQVPTHALNGVSLTIEAGEFVAIMGPSGSGKSTLLHILGFLDQPTSGRYLFEGNEIHAYSEPDLARIRNEKIGFIFQSFNLLSRTSVFDNVLLPLQYSRIPVARRRTLVEEALTHVNMTYRASHFPHQLSGGERQRAAIARALVNKPLVIFADEPTGNLDSKNGVAVMETIEGLHRQGHTVILITHETPTAAYAQRIIELRDGEMVADRQAPGRQHEHYQK